MRYLVAAQTAHENLNDAPCNDQFSGCAGGLHSVVKWSELPSPETMIATMAEGSADHMNDLKATLAAMTAERDGYKGAYETLSAEIGYMRQVAAPLLRNHLDTAAAQNKPGIFVVTLPKSGTVHIGHTIRQSLGYDFTNTLVTPTFPKNIIWPTMAADFQRGAMVSVSHMQADDENLTILKRVGLRKIVVHVRDPRAALLSWAHFRSTLQDSTAALPDPAVEMNLPFEAQIDAHIDGFYADAIDWLSGWLAVSPSDFDILWLTHETMSADEGAYFDALFNFHGLSGTKLKPLAKDANIHFRTGNNADWREALTAAQIARVNTMLPPALAGRFGWTY